MAWAFWPTAHPAGYRACQIRYPAYYRIRYKLGRSGISKYKKNTRYSVRRPFTVCYKKKRKSNASLKYYFNLTPKEYFKVIFKSPDILPHCTIGAGNINQNLISLILLLLHPVCRRAQLLWQFQFHFKFIQRGGEGEQQNRGTLCFGGENFWAPLKRLDKLFRPSFHVKVRHQFPFIISSCQQTWYDTCIIHFFRQIYYSIFSWLSILHTQSPLSELSPLLSVLCPDSRSGCPLSWPSPVLDVPCPAFSYSISCPLTWLSPVLDVPCPAFSFSSAVLWPGCPLFWMSSARLSHILLAVL